MTRTSEDKLCYCGNDEQWHKDNSPRHSYTPRGGAGPGDMLSQKRGGSIEEVPEPPVRAMRMPFDPVLRQALLDKGILTIDDLSEAEKKIRFLSEGLTDG